MHRFLSLDVPPELLDAHRLPGQFVEVTVDPDEPGAYFALANPPTAPRFELLVKEGEGVAAQLFSLGVGRAIWMSAPMGPGFPVEEARGKDVLLFATGSGFAPIRSLLLTLLEHREDYDEIHLFFGVRYEDDFPFADELAALPSRGVHTHLTVSRQIGRTELGTTSPRPPGRYVQERFREVQPPVEDAVAFLCGIEGMVKGVSAALSEAGLGPDRIHVNL